MGTSTHMVTISPMVSTQVGLCWSKQYLIPKMLHQNTFPIFKKPLKRILNVHLEFCKLVGRYWQHPVAYGAPTIYGTSCTVVSYFITWLWKKEWKTIESSKTTKARPTSLLTVLIHDWKAQLPVSSKITNNFKTEIFIFNSWMISEFPTGLLMVWGLDKAMWVVSSGFHHFKNADFCSTLALALSPCVNRPKSIIDIQRLILM